MLGWNRRIHIKVAAAALCVLFAQPTTHAGEADDGPKIAGKTEAGVLDLHNEVVAQVNSERIAKRDVEARLGLPFIKLESFKERYKAKGEWTDEAQEQYNQMYIPMFRDKLREMITESLLLQEFKEKKLEVDKQDYEKSLQERLDDLRAKNLLGGPEGYSEHEVREEVKREMKLEQVTDQFMNFTMLPNKRDVEAYYNSHLKDYPRKPGDKIRRIRVLRFQNDNLGRERVVEGSSGRAEELRKQATKETFADLAKEISQDDPKIVKNGGLLPGKNGEDWIDSDAISGPLGTALRGLKPGEISEIFQGDEKSWAFVLYEEHRDESVQPLDGRLYEEIRRKLTRDVKHNAEQTWLVKKLKSSLVLDAWGERIPVKFFFPTGEIPTDVADAPKGDKKPVATDTPPANAKDKNAKDIREVKADPKDKRDLKPDPKASPKPDPKAKPTTPTFKAEIQPPGPGDQ